LFGYKVHNPEVEVEGEGQWPSKRGGNVVPKLVDRGIPSPRFKMSIVKRSNYV
jgi:hypothetical protein